MTEEKKESILGNIKSKINGHKEEDIEDIVEEWNGPGLATIGLHVGQEEPDLYHRIKGCSNIPNIILCIQ